MSFNIFGAATKDNVRVGYVDPERGYITNQSIYEANVHASKNPGAVFILETRDRVRYLSINEVNKLGPLDITPDETSCQDGIKGLKPGETPAFPSGRSPIKVSGGNGDRIKTGANGGTPVTSGGIGGRPVTAGGKDLTSGGNTVTYGGSGGTPLFLGGTGGTPVFIGSNPLTISGQIVYVGGTGGEPLTAGGSGGSALYTDDGNNECQSSIYISGAGGVGAFAVPIVGTDGSVLAALVTDGGFGYKFPPQARVVDTCRRGVGTVLKTFLGTVATRTETYEEEDDFEIYDLTPPSPLSGYGKRFGPNGEDLGGWDPNLFATLAEDPIGRQIRDYQDFLKQGINPWWHTRKETPLEVIFREKNNRVKHDVQHWAWGGKTVQVKEPPSKLPQFEELEFEVYTQGGNNPERALRFVFTEQGGSHSFTFEAPEFRDNTKNKVKRKVKRNTKYTVSASGRYKGKGVEQGLVAGLGRKAKEIKGNKTGTVVFADFVESSNDNDDLQIRATQGKFTASNERKQDGHSINDLTYVFESNKDFKPARTKTKNVIEDSFMNRYAISPTAPSNVPGSDYAGRVATFVWEEDFPYSGDYKFRGMADNIGKIFIDNELVLEERKFRGDPTKVVSKYIEAGIHEIKVELFNIPIKEKPKTSTQQAGKVPVKFDVYGQGGKSSQLINYVFTSEDGKDSFTFKPQRASGRGNTYSYSRTVNVLPNVNYKAQAITTGSSSSGRKEFNIKYDGLNSANRPIDVSGSGKTIKLKDGHGNDTNASFRIMSTSSGVSADFSQDGGKLKIRGTGNGNVTLRLEWDDNPGTAGVAVKSITVGGKTWRQSGRKGEQEQTIKVSGGSGGGKRVEQGTLKKDTFRKSGKESSGESNVIFADVTTSSNDNDDMQIRCGTGEFTPSNRRRIDGHSTYDLRFRVNASVPKKDSGSNKSQKYESIFNTADYVNKADRKLWRTNVYGRRGFLSENGICPFDTKKPLEGNPYAGTHVIRWEGIDFPADGNYNITVDADDSVKIFIGNLEGGGKMAIGNGLRDIEKGGDEVIIENGMNKQTYTRFFKKGKYRIRTELTQIPGGRFSFDKNGKPSGGDITARFIERGGQNYLKVEGSGKARIHFRLRTDDDPGNSGSFASRIKIGKGSNDSVELKRSYKGRQLKEKETITESAFFEAGREYLIQTFNSNRDTGSRIKNKAQTLEYDDNISNGFDENADLTITKITDQQRPEVKGVNPMALAIDIQTKAVEELRISGRTWYQNPMGAAFTIDAPLPPIPQSPKPQSEGRCPDNPLWTTRFSGGSESWWPVTHPAWSKFTNRFAASPLPPLATPNSDGGGGITYTNTWQVDFPYDGFYGFKGSADDIGRILLDGQEVYKFKGFKNPSPKIVKQQVTGGMHDVTVEVVNRDFRKRKKVTKEFFNTQKWQVPVKEGPPTPAEVSVEYRGLSQGSTKTVSGEKSYAIRTEGESRTAGRRVRDNGRVIQFDDDIDNGFDENAKLTIESTSPGVSAKFNGDGTQMIVKGRGDVSLKFEWDDNPRTKGLSVGTLKVGNGDKVSWTTRQRGEKGSDRKTINVGANDTKQVIGKGGYIVSGNSVKMRDGHGDDINSTFSIVSSTVDAKFSSDGKKINYKGSGEITLRLKWDDNPKTAGKAVDSIAVGGKVWNQKGEKNSKTQTIKVTAESSTTGGVQSGKSVGGVTYTGPELFTFKHPAWSELMNTISVSPFTPPLDQENPAINGTFKLKWSGVKFSESGRYDIAFQADNIANLFINGTKVEDVRSFRGEPKKRFVELSRGTYDVEVELTNIPTNRDIFNNNPSGVALKITKDVTIVSSESPPWTSNPVAASAMIIPPPCPKVIEGTGFVERIEVIEPGNGHPGGDPGKGRGGGTPVTLQLIDIVPTKPGIGYTPGDTIIIEVPGRPPIEFEPELDEFGRITKVKIPRPPEPPEPGPPTERPGGSGAPPLGIGGITGNTETQILQVTDLPGDIGVADDTGVLIPLVPSGGTPAPSVPGPGEGGPYYGFTEYPNIYVSSDTGLGFRGRPVFKVVVVPANILPDESVLQVVDIPGLRQTGYVNGKPYYGQVFAKDGIIYAGISETIGELVPVYATLQESILNQQTVEPSAILRTGTEVSRNDPTLNIPNTPDNLI